MHYVQRIFCEIRHLWNAISNSNLCIFHTLPHHYFLRTTSTAGMKLTDDRQIYVGCCTFIIAACSCVHSQNLNCISCISSIDVNVISFIFLYIFVFCCCVGFILEMDWETPSVYKLDIPVYISYIFTHHAHQWFNWCLFSRVKRDVTTNIWTE